MSQARRTAFRSLLASRLLRGALSSEALRLIFQSGMFIVAARALGPDQLGRYAATMAVISFARPLVGLGAPHWLVRQARRNAATIGSTLSSSMLTIVASGLIASGICSAIAIRVSGVSTSVALLLAVSELLVNSIATLIAFVALAEGDGRRYAIVTTLPAGLKTVAAFLLVLIPEPRLIDWALLYASAALLSLIAVVPGSMHHLRRPTVPSRGQLSWGSQVAVSQLSQGAVNDLDKPFLTSAGYVTETGQYTAAYRLLNLAYFVVRAVETSAYPKFFEKGGEGPGPVNTLLKRVSAFGFAYGLLCVLIAQVVAPLSVVIFGESFSSTASYLRVLSIILPIKFVQWFVADALTALDRQGARTVMQLTSAALMALLLLLLVPPYGVTGAIVATIVVETIYLLALFMTYKRVQYKLVRSSR